MDAEAWRAWELLLTALATWQSIEIWHHSSLFASWRAWLETTLAGARFRLVAACIELLLCPFCLSVWVAAALAAWLHWAGDSWWALPVAALAAARLANLANDLGRSWCRTPGRRAD